ncbi:hypothetical protein BDZ89DRAFT_1039571 [Hymenopellis radicata]|nr:hypothetical protein BDZ89DRAFT_1039571 [Hymenopellis radicata]
MASFTPENMSGKYRLNKQLSTNMEELMQIQKVGWVVRKAVTSAPVALSLTHDNTTFNALAEVAGIPGTANNRRLDGTSIEEKHPILGLINKRAVVAVLGDVTEAFLKDAWKGLDPATKLVLTSYESVKEGWKTLEVTTVQEVDGQVRLVLYCFGTNDKGEVVCGRVVYDTVADRVLHSTHFPTYRSRKISLQTYQSRHHACKQFAAPPPYAVIGGDQPDEQTVTLGISRLSHRQLSDHESLNSDSAMRGASRTARTLRKWTSASRHETVYAFVTCVFLVVVVLLIKVFRQSAVSLVRGPPSSSWLLGHEKTLLAQDQVGDAEFSWFREYGSTLRIKDCFGVNRLMTADAKALQHILHTSGYRYPKTEDVNHANLLMAGNSIGVVGGATHQRHRKVLSPAFSSGQLRTFISHFQRLSFKVTFIHMDLFLQEGLRLHPILPFMSRQAQQDDVVPLSEPVITKTGAKLTEIPVEKGQSVWISIAYYNRNPAVWGTDADQWNPDRFLEGRGAGNSEKVSVGVYANVLTFSAGIRNCLGWRYSSMSSVMEMQTILTDLMESFRFAPCEGIEVRRAVGGIMMPIKVGSRYPLLVSRDGLWPTSDDGIDGWSVHGHGRMSFTYMSPNTWTFVGQEDFRI